MDEKKISQSAVAFIGIASSGLAIALWIDVKLANMVFVAILIISLISEIIAEYWRLSKE